ncbi:MAG TPA: hypothetical protein VFD58_19980 [Blastocatellia bacterium]|nr:hypothetical protein [Blastocatellia bacterium]
MSKKSLSPVLSLLLAALLIQPALPQPAVSAADQQKAREEQLKQRVVEWGTNKNVTVKLKSGGKVQGRLAEIRDDGFALQFVEHGQVTSREIRYGDVKGISEKGNAGNIVGGIIVGTLAAVGVTAIVVLVAVTSH